MIVSNLLTALILWRFFVWGNISDQILLLPYQKRKGTVVVSDMRGMWVIFCGLYVCLPVRAIAGCATGYAPIINAVADAIMAPMLGECEAGYRLQEVPDEIMPANGHTDGDGIALAETTYTQGDCPDGYVDLAVDDGSFFKINTNGTCTNGYRYTTEQCKDKMPNTPVMCGILCDTGLEYTEVGTCAELCNVEHNTLKTSTGLAYPIYATKSVTPSINLRIGESVCYVNLISGTESNSINIKYNNQLYHAVK